MFLHAEVNDVAAAGVVVGYILMFVAAIEGMPCYTLLHNYIPSLCVHGEGELEQV